MTSAKEKSRDLGNAGVFIDHAKLVEDDLLWLGGVERLTLWNVTVPRDFFAALPSLWWIDWRGGSPKQGVGHLTECAALRFLALNQIRELNEIAFISEMTSLEMIKLYGLAQLENLPMCRALTNLRRAEIGQMKSMVSVGPLLEAPNLEEIQLHNFVHVTPDDVTTMQRHKKLKAFEWYGENIPDKMWVPVRDAVALPKTRALHPEEWFGLPA